MEHIDNLKGIIFDYGGTIDSHGDHWSEIIWAAYKDSKIPVSKEDFRECYVFAERELARVRHILPHHNFYDLLYIKVQIEIGYLERQGKLPEGSVTLYSESVARYCYMSANQSIAIAIPVLEKLSSKYPMVLVSNFYGNVESVLTDFGLKKYFKQIIESAVVGIRKPDPRIFQLGVDALGFDASDILVVGDSFKKDILPAESIGCKVAWLKGKGWTDDEDAIVHRNIIKNLDELLDVAL
ncbi:MAG: HAD family hydrolase [Muribaculaceae bacterium]|nr:HAD family hydrolase [Muribaculaceae bacterium]